MAIKSLFIINDFPPILGGQSNYYFNLCKAFGDGELVILAPKCKGSQDFDQRQQLPIIRRSYLVNIFGFEKFCKIFLPLFYSLGLIKKEGIGCIHCGHVLSTGIIGLILKKWRKIPYIVYTHSADILEYQKYWPIKKLLQCVLNNADMVACNSRFTFDKLLDLGVSKEKIRLIYPKIDFLSLDRYTEIESLIKRYDLASKKIILSINRLVERKGNDMMVQAMPEVLKEIPNVVYLIAGKGPYEARLREMVGNSHIGPQVIFVKSLSNEDVIKFYKACDVFVMLSRSIREEDTEGFGITFLEAGACGKPVIGGRSGGIPEAVAEGYSGLLVDPLNVKEIAQAVIRVLKDKDYAALLGTQGKKRVQEQFDARFYKEDLKNLMEQIR